MTPEEQTPQRPDPIAVIRMVWVSLFAAILVLLVPFYLMDRENFKIAVDLERFLREVKSSDLPAMKLFPVIALGNIAVGILLPKLFVKNAMKESNALTMKHYFTPFIIRLALIESAALLGFALGFTLTKDLNNFLPFQMLTVFFFLRYIPLSEKKIRIDLNPYPEHVLREISEKSKAESESP